MTPLLKTEETISKVNGYFKKSVQNIIAIGTELNNVKTEVYKFNGKEKDHAELEYLAMYDELGFGKKVGEKFIKISKDKFIGNYIDKVPSSYNTLYTLTGKSENEFKQLIELGLNPTSTSADVKGYLDSLNGSEETPTKETSTKETPTKDTAEESNDEASADTSSDDKPSVTSNDEKSETKADDNTPVVNNTPSSSNDNDSVEVYTSPSLFGDEIPVVSVTIDETMITSEGVKSELLKLQAEVEKLVSKFGNGDVSVKTYDIPVVKVTAKVSSVIDKKAA